MAVYGIKRPSIPTRAGAIWPMWLIARKRVKLGLSQYDLGLIAGYPANSISQWERGERAPNLRKFIDLANAVGLELKLVEWQEKKDDSP